MTDPRPRADSALAAVQEAHGLLHALASDPPTDAAALTELAVCYDHLLAAQLALANVQNGIAVTMAKLTKRREATRETTPAA